MSNKDRFTALRKHRGPLLGMAAALIVLSVLLLWPVPASEPGVQSTAHAASSTPSEMLAQSGPSPMQSGDPHASHPPSLDEKKGLWRCPMHPEIQQDGPGRCPLCGMQLTPAAHEAANGDHSDHSHQSGEESMMSPDPQAGQRVGLTHAAQLWSCSMHPELQRSGPGQCPICGMALIPVRRDSSNDHQAERALTVSPAQRALMKIATVPVERRFPTANLRLIGKITYDENAPGIHYGMGTWPDQ